MGHHQPRCRRLDGVHRGDGVRIVVVGEDWVAGRKVGRRWLGVIEERRAVFVGIDLELVGSVRRLADHL
jgi:hypothetical protein